jgi:D-alanine-D-alanine ligase-like ATP-grasp enzyme
MNMPTKIRVGIIFGGRSAEHEVSLRSAKSIFDANEKPLREKLLFWKKYGGHLATVVGYKGNDEKPEGLYVHHTSIKPEYNWHFRYITVEEFETGFTGRSIIISEL